MASQRPAGISLLHLQGGPKVATADNCGLLHPEPGTRFPEHEHLGEKWALFLKDPCIEHTGIIGRTGDLVHKSTGSKHFFRVLDYEPFVFAVVLYDGFKIAASEAALSPRVSCLWQCGCLPHPSSRMCFFTHTTNLYSENSRRVLFVLDETGWNASRPTPSEFDVW